LKEQNERRHGTMKPFTAIASIVFILIAAAHLLRLLFGVEIVVNGRALPMWLSAVAPVLLAGLAWMLWREGRGQRGNSP
jgi:hypothetical protein